MVYASQESEMQLGYRGRITNVCKKIELLTWRETKKAGTLSFGEKVSEEDYTDGLLKHEGSRWAECRTVAHQMLLYYNSCHLVKLEEDWFETEKCFFTQWVIKRLELAATGGCGVGWCQQGQKGIRQIHGQQVHTWFLKRDTFTAPNTAVLDIGR